MFDYKSMLKRAIEYFPAWSDIRKRTSKSIGGQLIDSALKETLELESSINKYKDFYFLNKYDEIEDTVLAFAYKANVGELKDLSAIVKYNNIDLIITTSINDFYEEDEIAYYEDGNIYLKKEFVKEDKQITLILEDFKYNYNLELTHVWNIFDEYACFVGIERHENETNKELKDRILYLMRNPGSSTEEGLKNSIVTELMSMIEINPEDIEISKVTPENLRKPYKKYKQLLYMLDELNKDVLKDKRWDLDKWEYDFKSISFLENIWDDAVSTYQNGIGYDDDLKVIIADSESTTDAEIIMYNKSLVKLEKYVQDKHIKKDISFKLKRYENVLNPINAKYAIKASEAIDITNEDIELSIFETSEKVETRKVEEIYKLGKDVVAIDNSRITDEKSYRLEFYPNGNQDIMKVSKAKVIYKHKVTGEIVEVRNLLKAAPGFICNASGELVNTSIKKAVKSINHFNRYENLKDTSKGIVLSQGVNSGKGIVDVSGLGLNIININYEHELVDIPYSLIKQNQYAFWKDKDLVFRYDVNRERKFEIKTTANAIKFDIKEGEADLFLEVDGNTTYEKLKAPLSWSSNVYENAKDIKVTVISNHNGPVKFTNFKYCCHDINMSLQYGSLIKDSTGQYRLPNFPVNSLIITMTSKTSSSPILKNIFIGSNLASLKYQTDIIPAKDNTNRIIEISSNCMADLLTVDSVGNILYRNVNYLPTTSYKAIKNDAWIRLNLDEYDKVNTVICPDAAVSLIEESGKVYYNLSLKLGQSVTTVTIDGLRNTAARVITLEDMIKMYMPSFDIERDRIYANRLCKGLLIDDRDPDNPSMKIVNIKNTIFTGINSSKYKFTKLPSHLTVSFNSSLNEINNIETNIAFDSISIIPGGAKIYQAINEANIYTEEVRNIKVLNNFNPILNLSTLMYYEVTPFESNIAYDVKFSSREESNKSFDTLTNWTVGIKDIAIKTPISLSNTENYDITEIEITDEVLLSRYVDLKRSYKLANNKEVFTNKFMVIPEEGCTVLYERYSDKQNENLIVQEEVIMESDGFTKLSHSNIDELLYIGYSSYNGVNETLISEFRLLKEEGIILWTDKSLINQEKKVFLRYTIKNPISIMLNEDSLYKAIDYNVDAYDEISRYNIAGITDGYRFDLRQLNDYQNTDMIYTRCSSDSFKSEGVNDVLVFNKIAKKDTILVKTGYYYINGREYYLFPSKDEININNNKDINFSNVDISGDEITTFKATNNFVRNSEMLFRGINELYNYDASKADLEGVSFMNALTACDNFNLWNTFGMQMFLKNGLNQVGINFSPKIPNGYAYVELTKYLKQGINNYLSFWADKTLDVYIGEEKMYLDMAFPHSIDIKLISEIQHKNDNIRSAIIKPKDKTRYYLVVKNTGTIDDIMLSDKSNIAASHTKNIDLLNLKITEDFKSGQKHRVFIENKNIINKGAMIASDGKIKTAADIYWGLSPFKSYETKEDFVKCSTSNVNIENNYIYTGKSEGYLETAPIHISNPLTIKRLIFKINEIGFEDMRGMKIQILSSNTRNGDYVPVSSFNDNYGFVYGDTLLKYIKFKIIIPEKKYINNFNIYAEYCSTENNYPKLKQISSGELITKIFDTQFSNNYKIRDIDIENISNINDVDIYVQASKDDYSADVWHPWKKINLTNELTIKKELEFFNTRFFRFKVVLKTSAATIKINNIDIEVI